MNTLPEPTFLTIEVNHEDLNDLSILHLSDLHVSTRVSRESLVELVAVCDKLQCDFIVITGDVIDTSAKDVQDRLKILNSMKSPVYYVSGNHDLFYGLSDLKKSLENFVFMDNKCAFFNFNGKIIHIVGLPDRFSKFFKIERKIETIISYANKNSPIIFLAHQPKDFSIAIKANASLFLCGHTHGGQIFPFHYLVRLVQPFLSGLSYVGEMAIYVNRGLGTWGLHYRYKAPSEIILLRLKHAS